MSGRRRRTSSCSPRRRRRRGALCSSHRAVAVRRSSSWSTTGARRGPRPVRCAVPTAPPSRRGTCASSASSRCPSPNDRRRSPARSTGRGPRSARARLAVRRRRLAPGLLGSVAVPRSLRPGLYRGSVARRRPDGRVPAARRGRQRCRRRTRCTPGSSSGRITPTTPSTARAALPTTPACWPRYGIGDGTRGRRRRRRRRRAPDSLARRRVGRVAAARSHAGSRPQTRACMRACPRRCPTPTSATSRPRRPARADVRRWGEALRARGPGVRQLVTAPPDPTLGSHRRRVGDAPGRPHARRRSLTTHAASAPRPGCTRRAARRPGAPTLLLDQDAVGNLAVAPASWQQGGAGLLYWSVNDYTGDPYRDPINHGERAMVASPTATAYCSIPGRPLGLRGPERLAAARARRRRPADHRRGGAARTPRPGRRARARCWPRAARHRGVRRQPGQPGSRSSASSCSASSGRREPRPAAAC